MKLFDIDCKIVHQTEKALLIRKPGAAYPFDQVWLQKQYVEINGICETNSHYHSLTMPEWYAEKKELTT